MPDLLVLAIGLLLGSACAAASYTLRMMGRRVAYLESRGAGVELELAGIRDHQKRSDADLVRLNKDAGSFAERLNIRRND